MTRFQFDGNGSGLHTIVIQEVSPGHVVFEPQQHDPLPPNLAYGLSQAVAHWYRGLGAAESGVEISAVLPIVIGGSTAMVHVWVRRRMA